MNPGDVAVEAAIGAATGKIPGARISGVTSGRGSALQVFRQIYRKVENGTISGVTLPTALKMFTGRVAETGLLPGTAAAASASSRTSDKRAKKAKPDGEKE